MESLMWDFQYWMGTDTLFTINNVYTIVVNMFVVLYFILWFFKRPERKKIWDNFFSSMFCIVLPVCANVVFFAVQLASLDNNSLKYEYYPYGFYTNAFVIVTLTVWTMIFVLGVGLCKLRAKIPEVHKR